MITLRELSRATLARQLLLERVELDPLEAVERLAGLQAQTAQTWYGALQSRLVDFDPALLSDALEQRRAVRAVLMRGTMHLVAARDALEWEPLLRPVVKRVIMGAIRKALDGVDLEEVTAEGRRALEGAPLTAAELGRLLHTRWPDRDRTALADAVRVAFPLVQATPRGLWQRAGAAKLVPLQEWLGAEVAIQPSVDDLVVRYLAAFGPASVLDAQAWSGLTRLAEVFDRLRPRLVTMTAPSGRELFDLPDAPRPPGDAPAPVRYLYDFDNVLLSHADRSRFKTRSFFEWAWTMEGPLPSCLLIDGAVGGTWRIDRDKHRSVLEVRTLDRPGASTQHELEAEGAALLRFWAPDREHDIRIELARRS